MFSNVWLILVCGEISAEDPKIAPGVLLVGADHVYVVPAGTILLATKLGSNKKVSSL